MQVFSPEVRQRCAGDECLTPQVLGSAVLVDFQKFPELNWLPAYLEAHDALQDERDRLQRSIREIEAEGPVYRNQWVEPYTKTKNGKQYTYYQLRWLSGDRKKSGQLKVRTEHLSHRSVGEVRAAIERGKQVEALEQQCQEVDEASQRLRQSVLGMGRKFKQIISQNSKG